MKYAQVVIDAVIGDGNTAFDYVIPDDMRIEIGMRVLVPFGKTLTEGFVLGLAGETSVPEDKLKYITKPMDGFSAVIPEFLELLDDICYRFKLRKIDVLRLFVPGVLRGKKTTRVKKRDAPRGLDATTQNRVVLTEQQQAVVDYITNN